jgi:hypothetical protein
MSTPIKPKQSQLKELHFNSAINGELAIITEVSTAISGEPNNARFVPTVKLTVKNDAGIRLQISWKAEFHFVQERNINESHLFHAIQYVHNEIEKYVEQNKEQFGVLKQTIGLGQNKGIQENMHAILKQLYNKKS